MILRGIEALNQVEVVFGRPQHLLDVNAVRRPRQTHPAVATARAFNQAGIGQLVAGSP